MKKCEGFSLPKPRVQTRTGTHATVTIIHAIETNIQATETIIHQKLHQHHIECWQVYILRVKVRKMTDRSVSAGWRAWHTIQTAGNPWAMRLAKSRTSACQIKCCCTFFIDWRSKQTTRRNIQNLRILVENVFLRMKNMLESTYEWYFTTHNCLTNYES